MSVSYDAWSGADAAQIPCENCDETWEDHGSPEGLCECGHYHIIGQPNISERGPLCRRGCEPHDFVQEREDRCPTGDGLYVEARL